jgi:hypothetical protein
MPWAFEDGMAWKAGWTDLYPQMQEKVYQRTIQYADRLGCMIAPVGWAWYNVLKEQGYPLHYLHQKDWVHPTLKGSYLAACVFYSSIFLEPSSNNAYTAGIEEQEALVLQQNATKTVFDNIDIWNLEGINETSSKSHPEQDDIRLNLLPNPPSGHFTVEYLTLERGTHELIIYDLCGRMVDILVHHHLTPGIYRFSFDARAYNPGLYYCVLRNENFFRSEKLLITE